VYLLAIPCKSPSIWFSDETLIGFLLLCDKWAPNLAAYSKDVSLPMVWCVQAGVLTRLQSPEGLTAAGVCVKFTHVEVSKALVSPWPEAPFLPLGADHTCQILPPEQRSNQRERQHPSRNHSLITECWKGDVPLLPGLGAGDWRWGREGREQGGLPKDVDARRGPEGLREASYPHHQQISGTSQMHKK
jgi:hypothetical protein